MQEQIKQALQRYEEQRAQNQVRRQQLEAELERVERTIDALTGAIEALNTLLAQAPTEEPAKPSA